MCTCVLVSVHACPCACTGYGRNRSSIRFEAQSYVRLQGEQGRHALHAPSTCPTRLCPNRRIHRTHPVQHHLHRRVPIYGTACAPPATCVTATPCGDAWPCLRTPMPLTPPTHVHALHLYASGPHSARVHAGHCNTSLQKVGMCQLHVIGAESYVLGSRGAAQQVRAPTVSGAPPTAPPARPPRTQPAPFGRRLRH